MGRIVKNVNDGFIKYHGCGICHRDGSNVLITKNRGCSKPTNACFWMKPEYVNKRVTTRHRELTKTIHDPNPVKIYEREQLRNGVMNFYSTDDETMSNSNSGYDSDSEYDSDDEKLVIDINNAVNSTSNETQTVDSNSNENQTVDRPPDSKNDTEQTPDNK